MPLNGSLCGLTPYHNLTPSCFQICPAAGAPHHPPFLLTLKPNYHVVLWRHSHKHNFPNLMIGLNWQLMIKFYYQLSLSYWAIGREKQNGAEFWLRAELLPIFEFWGPLHPHFFNFGPGEIAHRPGISGDILLFSIRWDLLEDSGLWNAIPCERT